MTEIRTLTYGERMFFTLKDGALVPKRVIRIDASDGDPDSLPEDAVVILLNYKKNLVRGRKDPLKGRTVLSIPSDKDGRIHLPLEEAHDISGWLHSLSRSIVEQL